MRGWVRESMGVCVCACVCAVCSYVLFLNQRNRARREVTACVARGSKVALMLAHFALEVVSSQVRWTLR